MQEIIQLLSSSFEAPYSAVLSNSILIIVALVIIAFGIGASLLISHPEQFQSFIQQWRKRPFIKKNEKRFSEWLSFLLNRLRPGAAYGLSFTLSLITLSLAVGLFGTVIEDVLNSNGVALINLPIAHFITAHRIPGLTTIMRVILVFGSELCIVFLFIISGIFLGYRTRSIRPFFFIALVVGGAAYLDFAFTFFIHHPTAEALVAIVPANQYHIFTGDVAITIVYAVLAYLIATTATQWRSKILIWAIASILIFLIGVSSVYLGTTWTTDVFLGWSVGFVWLSIVLLVQSIIEKHTGKTIHGLTLFTLTPPTQKTIIPERAPFTVSENGLTEKQVSERRRTGETNVVKQRNSRSVFSIVQKKYFYTL